MVILLLLVSTGNNVQASFLVHGSMELDVLSEYSVFVSVGHAEGIFVQHRYTMHVAIHAVTMGQLCKVQDT